MAALKTQGVEFDLRAKDYTKRAFSSANDNMRRLKKNADKAQGSFARMRGGLKTLSTAMAGVGISAGAAVAGLVALVKASVQNTDMLAKTSKRIGITTQALVELKFAAEQSGIGFNTMQMALQRMSRRVAEAAVGTGEAKTALKELGINAQQFSSKPMEQQLQELAGAFENVDSHSQKLRLAFKLFDSEGVAMLNMLSQGAHGMRQMRNELAQLGGSVTEDGVRAAEELTDAWNRFTTAIGGAARKITTVLEPALTQTLDSMSRTIANFTAKSPLEKAARDVSRLETKMQLLQKQQKGPVGFLNKIFRPDIVKKRTAQLKTAREALKAEQEKFNKQQNQASKKNFAVSPASLEASLGRYQAAQASFRAPRAAKPKKNNERATLEREAQALRERFFTDEEKVQQQIERTNFLKEKGVLTEQEAIKYAALRKEEVIKSSEAYGDAQNFIQNSLTTEERIAELRQHINGLMDQGLLTQAQAEKALKKEEQALIETTKAYKKKQEIQARGKAVTKELLTPLEMYNDKLSELNKLLHSNVISQSTFNRGIKKAQKDLREATSNTADNIDKIFKKLGGNIEDSLVNAISGGKAEFKSFGDFAKSILGDISKDLTRAALRGLIRGDGGGDVPGSGARGLFNIIGNFFGGGRGGGRRRGGGGLFGGILGGISSFFGGGGASAGAGGFFTNSLGVGSSGADLFAGGFQRGGVLPAGKFGLVGEKGPELIASGRKPSTIYPHKTGKSGDVFNITMNIQAQDAESFMRSKNQILSGLGQEIQRAIRRNT